MSTHDPKFQPDKEVDFDTLYLWHAAWSGTGFASADPKVASESAKAAIGRFGGRWRAVSAGGATLMELLQHFDLKPTFRPRTEREDEYAKRGF